MTDVRAVGAVLLALGGWALLEGRRLVGLRNDMLAGAVVGDDTLPLLVGAALVVLGGYLLAGGRVAPAQAVFADAPTRRRMLRSAAVLAAYCAAMPHAGYTSSTAVAAVLLFRVMGGYPWRAAVGFSAALTLALYVVFRVWLKQPLPVGLLGG
jgi:hypothetical protein